MSGYIAKTKKTAAISATKTVYTALSSMGTDAIAAANKITNSNYSTYYTAAKAQELGISATEWGYVKSVVVDGGTGTVVYLAYCDGSYGAVYAYDSTTGKYNYTANKHAASCSNETAGTTSASVPADINASDLVVVVGTGVGS